ncbi:9422_t:CDS:2, partial [Gigaspora rosea]
GRRKLKYFAENNDKCKEENTGIERLLEGKPCTLYAKCKQERLKNFKTTPPQYLYTRTERKVEKYIEWKKVNDNIPLRLTKIFISSDYNIKFKSHSPKQALTTFKGLLNKGQLRDVPLDDIQRLAGYFAKVHPRNAIFVLEAALEHKKDEKSRFELTSKVYCEFLQCIISKDDLINGFIEHGDIKGAGQLFVDMLREGLAAPNIFIPNNQNSDKQTESNNLLTWEKTLLEQIYIILTQTFVYHDNLHQAKKY